MNIIRGNNENLAGERFANGETISAHLRVRPFACEQGAIGCEFAYGFGLVPTQCGDSAAGEKLRKTVLSFALCLLRYLR